jgi:hypothetical protein
VEENKVKGRRLQGLIKAEQENLKKLEQSKKKTSQVTLSRRHSHPYISLASHLYPSFLSPPNKMTGSQRAEVKEDTDTDGFKPISGDLDRVQYIAGGTQVRVKLLQCTITTE